MISAPAIKPAASNTKLNLQPVSSAAGERIVLYGTGGIGKTSLAVTAPGPVVFFDLDRSLGKLSRSTSINAQTVPADTYADLYQSLNSTGWDDIKTVVIDSASELEAMAEQHVLATVKKDSQGTLAKSLEDYGFGKGYRHLYDAMDRIVQALENHSRAGRNVILICHDSVSNVPNPQGENFIRYSPDMMDTKACSIRDRIKGWADHVLFVGYDVSAKDGKATGSGTRMIYTQEMPWVLAKSRTIKNPSFDYEEGSTDLWNYIFPELNPNPSKGDK